jgi:prepilin-type N-terminal cleavage/methylation domain-containing protein
MKNVFQNPVSRARASAFTLPELMIAMTVFLILMAGVVTANIFGLKMFQITMTKLTATAGVRKAMGKMTDEIRTCKNTLVGDVSNGVFVAHINGETQSGTGLLIYPTTNTAAYTVYFVNPADQSFRRAVVGGGVFSNAVTTVLAGQVTNSVVFSAQDYLGNVLTNSQNNQVIHVRLNVFRARRFGTIADHYLLETSVTRRAPP